MEFRYYYGSQADQFSFIRIPRALLTDPLFATLTLPSKMLYGLLLDRMGLSMRNGWFDELNRVYIIYQITEIQADLGLARRTAVDCLSELEKFGLVEKKRRGQGLPSILFVKNFLTEAEASRDGDPDTSDDTKKAEESEGKAEIFNGRSAKNELLESDETTITSGKNTVPSTDNSEKRTVESGKDEAENAEFGVSVIDDTESRGAKNELLEEQSPRPQKFKICTSRSSKSALQEVQKLHFKKFKNCTSRSSKSAPLNNYNNINNTYKNNTISSNLISSSDETDTMGYDGRSMRICREEICDRIEFAILTQEYPYEGDLLDGIVDIMLEVALNRSQTMRLAGATYPTQMVRDRFSTLNLEHIRYVLDCFKTNTTRIGNIKKYLMTALFNAPSTIGGYYTAAVNHDMSELVQEGQQYE